MRALAAVARYGPFFEIATDPALELDGGYRPLRELTPDRLRFLLAEYARRLPTEEPRVAASILFQSLAARIWSPAVACAALHGVVPDLSGLHWRWLPGAPLRLWLPGPAELPAGRIHEATVEALLTPLHATFTAAVKIADGLLWGNAAAALAALRNVPALGARERAAMLPIMTALLARPPLAGTMDGPIRRSCCLYYRVQPGGYCGDCPLPRVHAVSKD